MAQRSRLRISASVPCRRHMRCPLASSSRIALEVASTSHARVRRWPCRDGCGTRVHTIPDALATSIAQTRSRICSCASSSISWTSLITGASPHFARGCDAGCPGASVGNRESNRLLSDAILLALAGGAVGVILGAASTAVYTTIKHEAVVIPPEAWAGGQPDAIGALITAAGQRAGLTRRVTPHQLRHAFGSSLADAGGTIDEIQELLGHASMTSSHVYLHPDKVRLRDAVERVPSPRELPGAAR
jgi:Phage integrase family